MRNVRARRGSSRIWCVLEQFTVMLWKAMAVAVVQARDCRTWFMHLQSKHVVWRSGMRNLLVARSLGPGERSELPQRRGQWTSPRHR
jgi:hypothetical protein